MWLQDGIATNDWRGGYHEFLSLRADWRQPGTFHMIGCGSRSTLSTSHAFSTTHANTSLPTPLLFYSPLLSLTTGPHTFHQTSTQITTRQQKPPSSWHVPPSNSVTRKPWFFSCPFYQVLSCSHLNHLMTNQHSPEHIVTKICFHALSLSKTALFLSLKQH